jgi:hypothetical protein
VEINRENEQFYSCSVIVSLGTSIRKTRNLMGNPGNVILIVKGIRRNEMSHTHSERDKKE